MSIIGSELLLGAAGAGGYEIERSLRFNSADSAYLNRTPGSAGNRKTWTLSFWVKRGAPTGSDIGLFSTYSGSNPTTAGYFNSNDGITFYNFSGFYQFQLITTQVFRDYSAWYHFVFSVDTTQVTSSNRVKIYVNGNQITTFSTATYPSQNTDTDWNSTTQHQIGNHASYLTGYLADIHFIDGQALDPSSFGEFDDNGVWQPIAYEGTYGTNGFHLDFADNSTAAALGTDTSGNGNTWTVNNISVTAGAGNDSLVDSPTNYGTDTGAGGEVRGNYATLNPLQVDAYAATLSNGNLDYSTTVTNNYSDRFSTIGVSSGKWYAEATVGAIGNGIFFGVAIDPPYSLNYIGATSTSWGYLFNATKYNNGSSSAYGASFTANDVIGIALDLDAGTLVFYKNGSSQGTAYSSLPAGTYFIGISGTGTASSTFNFGQRPFAYTAPSGFKALCTTNLPEPTIADGSTAMVVSLWSGNSANRTISGLNFEPDLIWVKCRNTAKNHSLMDSVRGFGTAKKISSNLSTYEGDPSNLPDWAGYISGTTSDGYSITKSGTGASDWDNYNRSGQTYVGWTWDAGSSTVTNTQGSITSQVRANASAGFSVVTYTGTGTTATVGHGLGVAPDLVLCKSRSLSIYWSVYHRYAGTTGYLQLNSNSAYNSATMWNPVPNSTTLNFDSNGFGANNGSGQTYVAYCFAPVAGYSSFGSYTGNGNSDGPFLYTGFRPRWVLIKLSSSAQDWVLYDTERSPINAAAQALIPNSINVEPGSAWPIDICSNGFKPRAGFSENNSNGANYIYAAFAEHPFQSSRAR